MIWDSLFKKHVRDACESNAKNICNSECELCSSDIEKWKAWFDMWGIEYTEEIYERLNKKYLEIRSNWAFVNINFHLNGKFKDIYIDYD